MKMIYLFESSKCSLSFFKIENKIYQTKRESECVSTFARLTDVDGALSELDLSKTFITKFLQQIHRKSEEIIDSIRRQESPESAMQDIEKLKRAINSMVVEYERFQTETTSCLEKHRRFCIFREDLEKINSDLRELNNQLKNVDEKLGNNLSASKAALASFEQFEQTLTVSYSFKK